MKLIIGNKNYSTWSLRPWIFMQQNSLEFQEIRVPLFESDTDEKLAPYFSGCKVPVLLDEDLVVWDSLAILEYLADKYPALNAWPKDVSARAIARSVSAEMHSSFSALRNELPMNCRRTFSGIQFSDAALRDIERIKSLWTHCRKNYGQSGSWLFGDFSVADAMFAPVVLRFSGFNIELEGEGQSYANTVLENPFIQQWIADGKQETEVIAEDEIYD